MFKHVLVGVDGAPNGRDAIALASRLADPEAELTLVHVDDGSTPGVVAVPPPSPELAASQHLLERERAATGVTARLLSAVSTSPGRGLHDQAEQCEADLLVVGSCSHGRLGRAMLGDDTRAALNGAPCAVAVAAGGYAGHSSLPSTIGVGYDGSPESESALLAARELAAQTGARLCALEVVSLPTYAYAGVVSPSWGEDIEVMVADAERHVKALDGVEGHAVYGLTGEELAAFGRNLDLLVVGSHGHGPIHRMMLGSTANYLQRHACCSLLLMPRSHESR